MKIAFLCNFMGQPRYRRRIEGLAAEGAEARVLAFDRATFRGKPFGDELVLLGEIEHGRYLKRLSVLARALGPVRREARQADVLYCFAFDMLILGWVACVGLGAARPRLVVEVGDVQDILMEGGLRSRVMRAVERFLVARCARLVVTSGAFVREYYQGILGLHDVAWQAVENKVDDAAVSRVESERPDLASIRPAEGVVTIGHFGMLRCRRSWEILKRVAERGGGRFRISLRGVPHGLDGLEEEARATEGVEYGGPFVAPDDLPAIYRAVDLVWVCREYGTNPRGNWRLARSNGFYESARFGCGILARSDTEDARAVEQWDIGMALELDDVDAAVDSILSIDDERRERWRSNLARLPVSVHTLTDEHAVLYRALADSVEAAAT